MHVCLDYMIYVHSGLISPEIWMTRRAVILAAVGCMQAVGCIGRGAVHCAVCTPDDNFYLYPACLLVLAIIAPDITLSLCIDILSYLYNFYLDNPGLCCGQ